MAESDGSGDTSGDAALRVNAIISLLVDKGIRCRETESATRHRLAARSAARRERVFLRIEFPGTQAKYRKTWRYERWLNRLNSTNFRKSNALCRKASNTRTARIRENSSRTLGEWGSREFNAEKDSLAPPLAPAPRLCRTPRRTANPSGGGACVYATRFPLADIAEVEPRRRQRCRETESATRHRLAARSAARRERVFLRIEFPGTQAKYRKTWRYERWLNRLNSTNFRKSNALCRKASNTRTARIRENSSRTLGEGGSRHRTAT